MCLITIYFCLVGLSCGVFSQVLFYMFLFQLLDSSDFCPRCLSWQAVTGIAYLALYCWIKCDFGSSSVTIVSSWKNRITHTKIVKEEKNFFPFFFFSLSATITRFRRKKTLSFTEDCINASNSLHIMRQNWPQTTLSKVESAHCSWDTRSSQYKGENKFS